MFTPKVKKSKWAGLFSQKTFPKKIQIFGKSSDIMYGMYSGKYDFLYSGSYDGLNSGLFGMYSGSYDFLYSVTYDGMYSGLFYMCSGSYDSLYSCLFGMYSGLFWMYVGTFLHMMVLRNVNNRNSVT